MKDFKGYAVGGDDTEWRAFINRRINAISKDIEAEKTKKDAKDFDKKMHDLLNGVQNITGSIKI